MLGWTRLEFKVCRQRRRGSFSGRHITFFRKATAWDDCANSYLRPVFNSFCWTVTSVAVLIITAAREEVGWRGNKSDKVHRGRRMDALNKQDTALHIPRESKGHNVTYFSCIHKIHYLSQVKTTINLFSQLDNRLLRMLFNFLKLTKENPTGRI